MLFIAWLCASLDIPFLILTQGYFCHCFQREGGREEGREKSADAGKKF